MIEDGLISVLHDAEHITPLTQIQYRQIHTREIAFAEAQIPVFTAILRGIGAVVNGHAVCGELLFGLHRMHGRVQHLAEHEQIILGHQFVRDAHELAEHLLWRVGETHIVAEGFRHLLHAVQTFQQRQSHANLGIHALFLLQITADEDVEKLVAAADLHVCTHHHTVPALHDRILKFMQAHLGAVGHAALEIFALEHLLERHASIQLDHFHEAHFFEPGAVEHDFCPFFVEHQESLLRVGLRIGQHLIIG